MPIEILVVDDSMVMRSMIKKTINLCGLDVENIYEASNGKEGLDMLRKREVDLLFIDVNMPIMDGMEMLDKVRNNAQTTDLSILIVSTESHEDRIEKINQQNAGFVHKPFTPEILRSKILGMIGDEGEAR